MSNRIAEKTPYRDNDIQDADVTASDRPTGVTRGVTFGGVKAWLKTFFDGVYASGAALTAHVGDTNNPHAVSAAQVGLGNVNNTADADKPVSTAQQTAIAAVDAKAEQAQGTANDALGDATTAQQKADLAQDTADQAVAALPAKADLVDGTVPAAQLPALALNDANVAHVQITGDDATGEIGKATKPFRTAQAAYQAATDSDTTLFIDAVSADGMFDFADRCYLLSNSSLHVSNAEKNHFRLATAAFTDRFARGAAYLFAYAKEVDSAVVTLTLYDRVNETRTIDFSTFAAKALTGATLLSAGVDRLAFFDGQYDLFNLKYSGPGTLDTAAAADLNDLANWAVGTTVTNAAAGNTLVSAGTIANGAALRGGHTISATMSQDGYWNFDIAITVFLSFGGNVASNTFYFYESNMYLGTNDETEALAIYYPNLSVDTPGSFVAGKVINVYFSGQYSGGDNLYALSASGDSIIPWLLNNQYYYDTYYLSLVYNGGWRNLQLNTIMLENNIGPLSLTNNYYVCDLAGNLLPRFQYHVNYGVFEKTLDDWATKEENDRILIRLGVGAFALDGAASSFFTRIRFAGAGYGATTLTLQNFGAVDIVGDDSIHYRIGTDNLSARNLRADLLQATTNLTGVADCDLNAGGNSLVTNGDAIRNSHLACGGGLKINNYLIDCLLDCNVTGNSGCALMRCTVTGSVTNCALIGCMVYGVTLNGEGTYELLDNQIIGNLSIVCASTKNVTFRIYGNTCSGTTAITNNNTGKITVYLKGHTTEGMLQINGTATNSVIVVQNSVFTGAALNLANAQQTPVKLAVCSFTGNVTVGSVAGNFKLVSCVLPNYEAVNAGGNATLVNCYGL
ncbi:MAG: phage protease [Verrucomicrobiales bacterium]|jgi:hypothetical protein|nr:phage protease [Verrucomicrobiales bacterium]